MMIFHYTDEDGDRLRVYREDGQFRFVIDDAGGAPSPQRQSLVATDAQVRSQYAAIGDPYEDGGLRLPDPDDYGRNRLVGVNGGLVDLETNARVRALKEALLAVAAEAAKAARNDPDEPATSDLKPRGVKRQWWLMPMDAMERMLRASAGGSDAAALAGYQREPCEATAAALASTMFKRLTHEVSIGLIPTPAECATALDEVVQVFEHGAEKYTANNWRGAAEDPEAFRREYLSSIARHTWPTNGKIDLDHTLPDGTEVKGSGLRHGAHAVCASLMVLWHEMRWAREEREKVEAARPRYVFPGAPIPFVSLRDLGLTK